MTNRQEAAMTAGTRRHGVLDAVMPYGVIAVGLTLVVGAVWLTVVPFNLSPWIGGAVLVGGTVGVIAVIKRFVGDPPDPKNLDAIVRAGPWTALAAGLGLATVGAATIPFAVGLLFGSDDPAGMIIIAALLLGMAPLRAWNDGVKARKGRPVVVAERLYALCIGAMTAGIFASAFVPIAVIVWDEAGIGTRFGAMLAYFLILAFCAGIVLLAGMSTVKSGLAALGLEDRLPQTLLEPVVDRYGRAGTLAAAAALATVPVQAFLLWIGLASWLRRDVDPWDLLAALAQALNLPGASLAWLAMITPGLLAGAVIAWIATNGKRAA